jgi:hypothetical protein
MKHPLLRAVTLKGSGAAGRAVASKAGTKAGRRSTLSNEEQTIWRTCSLRVRSLSMRRQRLLVVWWRKDFIEIGQILWR